MDKDCIFCKIVKGEAPAEILWEDDDHIAFLSIYPNTKGFTVVATKDHKPSYAFENDDEVLKNITIATKNVALLLDKAFEDVGRTGMFFEGFGVDHLHSKLFPMHGTGNMQEWRMIESEHHNKYFDIYPGYLSSNSGPKADEDELHEVAEKIREVKN